MPSLPGTELAKRMSRHGKLSIETMEKLSERVTPDLVADTVCAAMAAEINGKAGAIPDHRTRLEACKLFLNYIVGMPVQRQEIVTKDVKSDQDVIASLVASPAAMAALERRISAAKASLEAGKVPQ